MMLSRRGWLLRLLALTSVTMLNGRGHAADTSTNKVSKETAKYQDYPNNMQMCGMCKFYIPRGGQAGSGTMGGRMGPGMMGQGMMGGGGMMAAGTCQVVEGSINSMGWCVLYQPISQ